MLCAFRHFPRAGAQKQCVASRCCVVASSGARCGGEALELFRAPRFRHAEKRRWCARTPSSSKFHTIDAVFNALGMRAIVASLSRNCQIPSRSRHFPVPHVSRLSNGSRRSFLHHEPFHGIPHTLRVHQHRLYHSVHDEPTIYALSTASGRAAIAVIRISGSACTQVCAFVFAQLYTYSLRNRSTRAYALRRPSQSLDMQLSASCMPRTCLYRPQRHSTPAP
jgi:hypothetical protein